MGTRRKRKGFKRNADVLSVLFPRKRLWRPTERWRCAMQGNLARAPRLRSPEESRQVKEAVWAWLDLPPSEKPTLEKVGRRFEPPVSKQYLSRLARTLPPRPAWPSSSRRAPATPQPAAESRYMAAERPKPEDAPAQPATPDGPAWMTAEESIAPARRGAEEWKRKNPYYGGRRGGWFRR